MQILLFLFIVELRAAWLMIHLFCLMFIWGDKNIWEFFAFSDDFAGVDWEVFRKITKLMNISIRYVPPSNDTLLGELDENSTPSPTWRGGLLGNLANDLADIAFCGLWIETRKIRGGLQMSKPFQQVCYQCLPTELTKSQINVSCTTRRGKSRQDSDSLLWHFHVKLKTFQIFEIF